MNIEKDEIDPEDSSVRIIWVRHTGGRLLKVRLSAEPIPEFPEMAPEAASDEDLLQLGLAILRRISVFGLNVRLEEDEVAKRQGGTPRVGA